MTRKQRSFLFFLMVFIFIIVGPITILYSQGYRFDFQNKKIVQTGAFYFRVSPRSVQIEIKNLNNEKIRNISTDFIFGTAYIENLLPKKYEIEISKKNYHSWKKVLSIREKMATETKNITLVPENPEFSIIMENVENLLYSHQENIFIIELKETNNQKNIYLYDLKNNDFSELSLIQSKESLLNLINTGKRNEIIIETDKEKNNYYLLTIGKENGLMNLDLPSETKKISYHPEKKEVLIFLKENKIFSYDYNKKETSIFLDNVIDYYSFNNNFIWISDDGFLMENFENPKKTNKINLEIDDKKEYEIILIDSNNKIIRINNNFYFWDNKNLTLNKKFESKYNPILSPDSKKIVYSNGYEIRILFIDKDGDQPQRKKFEDIFLTRFSKKLNNINWYNSHYLLFNVANQIKIMEIDNRDNINIVELIEFENPELYFDSISGKLYVLSESKLFVSEKLLP